MNIILRIILVMTVFLLIFIFWGSSELNKPQVVVSTGKEVSNRITKETMRIAHYSEGSPSGFIVINIGNIDFFIRTLDDSKPIKFAKKNLGNEVCLSYKTITYDSGIILHYYVDSNFGECNTPRYLN